MRHSSFFPYGKFSYTGNTSTIPGKRNDYILLTAQSLNNNKCYFLNSCPDPKNSAITMIKQYDPTHR